MNKRNTGYDEFPKTYDVSDESNNKKSSYIPENRANILKAIFMLLVLVSVLGFLSVKGFIH